MEGGGWRWAFFLGGIWEDSGEMQVRVLKGRGVGCIIF